LALTPPTGGGRSVGTVRLRTKATEFSCFFRHLKPLVYAAPVDNADADRTVDACQTIRNYPGIFVRMRWSMMRRVTACIEVSRRTF
jgi:hypothetical protein